MKDDIYNNIDYSFKPTKTDDPPFSPHGGMDFIPAESGTTHNDEQLTGTQITLNTYPVKESIARAEILTIGRIKDLRLKRITKWFSKYDKDSKIGNIIIDICFDHMQHDVNQINKLSTRLKCLANYINTCPYISDISILFRGIFINDFESLINTLDQQIPINIRKNIIEGYATEIAKLGKRINTI